MKTGGRIGGIAAFLLLLSVCVACVAEEHLFLNGDPLDLPVTLLESDGALLAPLTALAPRIGVEVVLRSDATASLRWDGGRLSMLAEEDALVPVDWLVELTGGAVRRFGSAVHLETTEASVASFDTENGRVVVRFDRFVPIELIDAGTATTLIRFHHAAVETTIQAFLIDDGPILRAELRTNATGGVDLLLTLREAGAVTIEQLEAESFFAVTLGVDVESWRESVCILDEGFRLVEIERPIGTGVPSLVYIHVDNWRSGYRIEPAIASASGERADLQDLSGSINGEVAIGLPWPCDPLVIGGVPIRLADEPVLLLTVDTFGRPASAELTGEPFLRLEAETIPLDGVNRPLKYGEVVAFTPGYAGGIAPGVPGRFTLVKLRHGQVVSAFEGAFIDQDPTATMVIASGEAGSFFTSAGLGDDARLTCLPTGDEGADTGSQPLVHAFAIDAVLIEGGFAYYIDESEDVAQAWSVLVIDVLGGLTMLRARSDVSSPGMTRSELLAYLGDLPTRVTQAYALSGEAGPLHLSVFEDYAFQTDSSTSLALVLRSITE